MRRIVIDFKGDIDAAATTLTLSGKIDKGGHFLANSTGLRIKKGATLKGVSASCAPAAAVQVVANRGSIVQALDTATVVVRIGDDVAFEGSLGALVNPLIESDATQLVVSPRRELVPSFWAGKANDVVTVELARDETSAVAITDVRVHLHFDV